MELFLSKEIVIKQINVCDILQSLYVFFRYSIKRIELGPSSFICIDRVYAYYGGRSMSLHVGDVLVLTDADRKLNDEKVK